MLSYYVTVVVNYLSVLFYVPVCLKLILFHIYLLQHYGEYLCLLIKYTKLYETSGLSVAVFYKKSFYRL